MAFHFFTFNETSVESRTSCAPVISWQTLAKVSASGPAVAWLEDTLKNESIQNCCRLVNFALCFDLARAPVTFVS